MKTQLILKTAVVAMAAFGAFAFSGSENTSFEQFYRYDGGCTYLIEAMCNTSGTQSCLILVDQEVEPVYDLECAPATHVNSNPVSWTKVD